MSAAAETEERMLLQRVFDGHQLRVLGDADRPLFVAADVCSALGIKNVADTLSKRIPEDERGLETFYTPSGSQALLVVTEPGLYRLIFRSNKDEARRLQKFVFAEVLPSIRKTGRYSAPGAEPELVAEDPELAALRSRAEGAKLKFAVIREAEVTLSDIDGSPSDMATLRASVHRVVATVVESHAEPLGRNPGAELPASGRATVLELARFWGRSLTDRQAVQVGRIAADLFRSRHGRGPYREHRIHRGASQAHAVYAEADHELVRRAVEEVLDAEPLPPRIGRASAGELN